MKNDKMAFVVQARMNSSRLPGKVLKSVHGKPMIAYLLERLSESNVLDRIIVATSKEKSDNPIFEYCQENNVEVFRGALDNTSERFKKLIEKYELESFFRICGDSPMIDQRLVDEGIEIFQNGDSDIVTNILKRTFPIGQSYSIVRSDIFLEGYEHMKDPDDFEHVITYFLKNPQQFRIHNVEADTQEFLNVNLSIDTQDDYDAFVYFMGKLEKPFVDYDWKEMAEFFKDLKRRTKT